MRAEMELCPLLLFFHGLGSTAWFCALEGTDLKKLANQNRSVVVFGQGQGCNPLDRWEEGGFGECFWEIRYPCEDFVYIERILSDFGIPCSLGQRNGIQETPGKLARIRIDATRVYYMGYSNGAMFSCNVAIRYGGSVFAGICNMMGGWAGRYKQDGLLNVQYAKHPTPLLIISGTHDTYLPSCKKAQDVFRSWIPRHHVGTRWQDAFLCPR